MRLTLRKCPAKMLRNKYCQNTSTILIPYSYTNWAVDIIINEEIFELWNFVGNIFVYKTLQDYQALKVWMPWLFGVRNISYNIFLQRHTSTKIVQLQNIQTTKKYLFYKTYKVICIHFTFYRATIWYSTLLWSIAGSCMEPASCHMS